MKKVLTIAGSDSSGGAGIQADIKTMSSHRIYGMSVVTALTAQNTTGVQGIMEVSGDFVSLQLDAVFRDISPDAIKIGMVSNREVVEAIAGKLEEYGAKNIVFDPVMISTSGSRLLDEDASEAVEKMLMPIANIITPNIPEAEVLSGLRVKSKDDMESAAKIISETIRGAVLIKGGHLEYTADDLLYVDGECEWIAGERIDNPNTHGTGCTLSSAIACNMANGLDVRQSVVSAKQYINGAIRSGLDIGRGSGPLDHCWNI